MSLRGLVLGFDAALGTGLLRGDDGKRYVFAIDDWLAKPRPRPGQLVDFELHKGMALEIFIIKNAGLLDGLALGESFSTLSRQFSRTVGKYAVSARLLMPLAIMVLFALPFMARGSMAFSGFNTVGYVRDVLEDTGTFSAIGSAETRAVMEAGRNALYLYLLAYILPLMAGYKLMRGLQGHKSAQRLLGLSVLTIGLIVLLPLLVLGWFHLFAPAGNPALKRSVLANLSLDLPAAYLNYGWGAILLLGLGLLGLMNSFRKGRPIGAGQEDAAGRRSRITFRPRRRQTAAKASNHAQPQPHSHPVQVQMQEPPQQPVQPRQPQPPVQPQPAPQPEQQPQQAAPVPRPQPARQPVQQPVQPTGAPLKPQPAPAAPPLQAVRPAPATRQVHAATAEGDDFFDNRAEEEGDEISELLRRIRQEEGEA